MASIVDTLLGATKKGVKAGTPTSSFLFSAKQSAAKQFANLPKQKQNTIEISQRLDDKRGGFRGFLDRSAAFGLNVGRGATRSSLKLAGGLLQAPGAFKPVTTLSSLFRGPLEQTRQKVGLPFNGQVALPRSGIFGQGIEGARVQASLPQVVPLEQKSGFPILSSTGKFLSGLGEKANVVGEQQIQKQFGVSPQSPEAKIAVTIGDIFPTLPALETTGGAVRKAPALLSKLEQLGIKSKVGQEVAKSLVASPVETSVVTAALTGKPATATDFATGAVVDSAIPFSGAMGKEGYRRLSEIFGAATVPASTLAPAPAFASDVIEPKGVIGESIPALKAADVVPFDPKEYVKQLVDIQDTARRAGLPETFKGKVSDFYVKAKESFVDLASPIEDFLNKTQKEFKFELAPKDRISLQIDRALKAPLIAGQFMKDHGLVTVLQSFKSTDDLAAFDQYLIAKQALDVEAGGIKTGRDLAKDKLLIASLAKEMESKADVIKNYADALLDKSVETGLISADLSRKLKALYPNYVPINRIFSVIEEGTTGVSKRPISSLSAQSVIKKLKGSERAIENPTISLLSRTDDLFAQGERNVAGRILAGYKDLPGWEGVIKELKPGESAQHTFSFLDDGKKRTFETTKEIADAAKNLKSQHFNIIQQVFSIPTRFLKLGATGVNVAFAGANLAKDRLTALINSDSRIAGSLLNPISFVDAFLQVAGKGEKFEELVRMGSGGTAFDVSRQTIARTRESIRAGRSPLSRARYLVTKPGEMLKAVENIIGIPEQMTRLQVYEASKRMFQNAGYSLEDAQRLAADEANNVTANFFRRGAYGHILNSTIPYLNAGVQGNRAFIRALARDPKGTIAKTVTTLFVPAALATIWNLSNPAGREAYLDIPDYEKENNLIIIPPNPVKGEDGKWNVIKIPLPPNFGNLIGPIRRSIEHITESDPATFAEIANDILGSFSPVDLRSPRGFLSSIMPQAFKSPIEALDNRNLFTGAYIVPYDLQDLPKELQYKETSPEITKRLGALLNISPLQIENFIKTNFAGSGQQALNAADQVLAGLGIIEPEDIGGKGPIESLFGRFSKSSGGATEQREFEELQVSLSGQAGDKFLLRQDAEDLFAELKALDPEDANERAKQVAVENPDLYKELVKVFEDDVMGLTSVEKQIKQLNVTNGERAKYIFDKLKQLPPDEANAKVQEWIQKKIITKDVQLQLAYLLQQASKQK